MNTPVADLRVASLVPGFSGPAPQPPDALQWSAQLQHAQARLALAQPARSRPEVSAGEAPAELESCGAPVAAAMAVLAAPPPAPTPPASDESPSPPRENEREAERVTLRIHVQAASGEGLKVWLGIDGDPTLVAQRASAAVADLRRNLQFPGGRIAAVVCNGVPVEALRSCAAESPQRIAQNPSFAKDAP